MSPDHKSSFKAGIFVIVCVALTVLGIMVLGQRERLLTRHEVLWTEFKNARGLIPGAAVRVAGVTAGSVGSLRIVPSPGHASVVKVSLDIIEDFLPFIRADSAASIRTLGALGDKYVEISLGSTDQPQIEPGGSVLAEEPVDFYELGDEANKTLQRAGAIAEELAKTMAEFRESAILQDAAASMTSVRNLLEQAETGEGIVHKLLTDKASAQFLEDLQATTSIVRETAEAMKSGKGPLGQLFYGEALDTALEDVRASAGSIKRILAQVEEGEGTAHALIYGAAHKQMVDDMAAAASSRRQVLDALREGDGAAHAVIYDAETAEILTELRAAATNMNEATRKMNAVMTDIEEARGTLGLLVADPEIWEQITRFLGGAEKSKVLKYLIQRSAKPEEDEGRTDEHRTSNIEHRTSK